jgi:RNA polymerase sigma-70 factor (ECF subfamily)
LSAERPALERALRGWFARRLPMGEVDDAVQETFLRLHARRDQLRDPARLRGWAFAVARRVLADRGRRAAREARLAERIATEPAAGAAAEPHPLAPCVPAMLAELGDADRRLLRAVDLEASRQSALAAAAGVPRATVKARVQRARRRLRARFEACCRLERDGRGRVLTCEPQVTAPPCACATAA